MEEGRQSNSTAINGPEEQRTYGNPVCREFLHAVWVGDKNTINHILQQNSELIIGTPITPNGETILLAIAVDAQEKYVYAIQQLLAYMNPNDLKIANNYGTTALHFAALAGNKDVADLILQKDLMLAKIENRENVTPLYMAAITGHRDMVEYLLRFSNLEENVVYGSTILNVCITSGLYGVALQLVQRFPSFAVTPDSQERTSLEVLAQKPSTFDSETGFIYKCRSFLRTILKKVAADNKSSHQQFLELLQRIWVETEEINNQPSNLSKIDIPCLFFEAAYNNNYEFIVDLLRRNPDLIYRVNSSNHSIFHVASIRRCEPIFSLIYEFGPLKDFIADFREDDTNNTMLHLVARLAPRDQLNLLPGAALQMQRELLWYKEVEKIVPDSYKEIRNRDGKTPHDIFTEEHATLMKEGEKWMKKTAEFCMVVSTLIATVIFTAIFSVPGGINNNDGVPIYLGKKLFSTFVISEIIGMLSACTSIVMFLSILTSRYAEQDFLGALPFWLITGTAILFISLTSMMVSFCSALILLFGKHGIVNVPVLLVGLFMLVPLMFVGFKYPLLADIISSTYGSQFLFSPRERLHCK